MSLENDVERGRLAREVLENPIYAEAYDTIEREITSKWRDSRDKDEREHLHRLLLSLTKARQIMDGVLNSGRIAEKALELERSRLARAGQRLSGYFTV